MKARPVQRLRRRLIIAFTAFALLVASVFGFYALVFMYAVEDSTFNAQLAREAQLQLAHHARSGQWAAPHDATIQLHVSPSTFPADLHAGFEQEPWRSEISGQQGRHYHLKRIDPPAPAAPVWLVSEVSSQLVVRPIRDEVVMLLAGTALVMVLLAILLGLWLAHRGTASLYRLVEQVEALPLAPVNDTPLQAGFADDEIGVLAQALDRLNARVAAFIQREHAFTRDASHELRTPLAVISSASAQLLKEPALSARGREHLQHIRLSALQLQQSVTALLALAREEADNTPSEPVELVPLLEQIIIEQAPLLGERPVEVALALDADACMQAPAPALRMVLSNLVGNAFAHTQRGTVRISMQGPALCVDNSAAEASLGQWPAPRPFDKGDASDGSGLGLEIMRRLCDHHGLHLQIERSADGVRARLLGSAPAH